MPKKFTSRTAWREKLERTDHSQIVEIPAAMAVRLGTGKMLSDFDLLRKISLD